MGTMHYLSSMCLSRWACLREAGRSVADTECSECSFTATSDDKQEQTRPVIQKDRRITIRNVESAQNIKEGLAHSGCSHPA
jgi:hypothetical protein